MNIEEYQSLKSKDERRIWKAVYLAVIIHIVIFLAQWNMPGIEAVSEPPEPPIIITLPPIPPPPPEDIIELPERRVFIPIPDPEPEAISHAYNNFPPEYNQPGRESDDWPVWSGEEFLRTGPLTVDYEELGRPPVRIAGEAPSYPEVARLTNTRGIVTALIVVDTEGSVSDIQIIREIGGPFNQHFNNEVIRALSTYRYTPAKHNGEAVKVRIRVEFEFRLR